MKSFAKINLTLDILGKRSDGYHEIRTIYQTMALHDTVEVEENEKIIFKCNIKKLQNKHNLAYKAAELLKKKFGVSKGAKITITKNIPAGAGLSGGSSNAAAVLKELNRLWELHLSDDELMEMSKELGMDVPFHIIGGTCLGTGRGEMIKKLPHLRRYYVVLVYPGFGKKTKEAYENLEQGEMGKAHSTDNFLKDYGLAFLHNDFEDSVFKTHPELKGIKEKLGPYSLLAGSGTSVFGMYERKEEAEKRAMLIKNAIVTETWN